jgi:ribosomal protein L29
MKKKTDNNIKGMKADELKKQVLALGESLREFRFKAVGSKSKNVKEAKNLRKQIAQALTEMNKNNINKK